METPSKRIHGALRAAGAAVVVVAVALAWSCARADNVARLPAPAVDVAPPKKPEKPTTAKPKTVVFSGGCFWGVQAVFQHVKGVSDALSGYSGGAADTAQYDRVSQGDTGHAESVRVTFDPAQVSFGKLLDVFFSVAHDPTELNRQGPDEGSQYRSVIFFTDLEQRRVADAYIAQLDGAKALRGRIVTEVAPLKAFYPAEGYHQNYATLHPDNPYIVVNDAPKVAHLRQLFPELYRADIVKADAPIER